MNRSSLSFYSSSIPVSPFLSSLRPRVTLQGLMEIWSNVSGNNRHNWWNSRWSDTAVHRSSSLLLSTPGIVTPVSALCKLMTFGNYPDTWLLSTTTKKTIFGKNVFV